MISEVIAQSVQNFVERDFHNGKWKVFSFQILSVVAAFVNAGNEKGREGEGRGMKGKGGRKWRKNKGKG